MANVTVYNMEGNEVGTMELNDAVFGVEINEHLVQDLWLTVPNITVMQVPTVPHLTQVKYSKAKKCRDRWDMFR